MKKRRLFLSVFILMAMMINIIPVAADDKGTINPDEVMEEVTLPRDDLDEDGEDLSLTEDPEQKEETIIDVETSSWEVPHEDGVSEEEPVEPGEGEVETPVEEVTPFDPSTAITYRTDMEKYGWQDVVSGGITSGFPGESLRIEGLILDASPEIGLTYGVHVSNLGWQEEKTSGELAGTTGQSRRIEALWIDVNEETKKDYALLYRVYVEDYGWLAWSSQGHKTGSVGFGLKVEALQVILVEKTDVENYTVENLLLEERVLHYKGHVQNIGWQEEPDQFDMMGTIGKSLRLEAIDFRGNDDLVILHQAHVAQIGWTKEMGNEDICGSQGQSLAMEAIKLKLSGESSERYDLYYRVHVQRIGWMDWTKNGTMAGTSALALRIEAIQIRVIPKGVKVIPTNDAGAFIMGESIDVKYQSYGDTLGWQEKVSSGEISGTIGQGKRMEAFTMSLENNYRVDVSYSAFIEGSGWQDFANEPDVMGVAGQGKRIEAIKVKLQSGFEDLFHVYYRLHVAQLGWLDWSMDGNPNGTLDYGYPVEAMEVVVLPKTKSFPGEVKNPYVKKEPKEDMTVAKKRMVYYTLVQTSLYHPSSWEKIGTIPKGSFLFPGTDATGWISTEFNGVEGVVSGDDVKGHMVTVAGSTIIVNKRHGVPSSFSPGVNYEANGALQKMVKDAARGDIELNMYSGYRTYAYQKQLYDNYVKKDGRANADTYSMRPGFSEHHTGLAFDIGGRDSSLWTSSAFGNTSEGKWLKANAPYYGFILRYPKNKEHITGIRYEPWHFRYVGRDLALEITASGKCLDEYFNVVAPNY